MAGQEAAARKTTQLHGTGKAKEILDDPGADGTVE
jgi:hypothetical protein